MVEVRPTFIITVQEPKGYEQISESTFTTMPRAIEYLGTTPNKILGIHKFSQGVLTKLELTVDNGVVTLKTVPEPPQKALEFQEYDSVQEYREAITRTMNKDLTHGDALAMLAMGLSGEVGELVDMLKKYVFHDHELDEEEVKKELGDISWYYYNLMNQLNIKHEEVQNLNLFKLSKRYPKGFSSEDSKKRVDTKKEDKTT